MQDGEDDAAAHDRAGDVGVEKSGKDRYKPILPVKK